MSRFVCSARVVETFVRQTCFHEGARACSTLPKAVSTRSARPFSRRFLSLNSTIPLLVDQHEHDLSKEAYVPLLNNHDGDAHAQLPIRSITWPASQPTRRLDQAPFSPEYALDKATISNLANYGIMKENGPGQIRSEASDANINHSVARHDELDTAERDGNLVSEVITRHVPVLPDVSSSFASNETSDLGYREQKLDVLPPTRTRVDRRKERKIRRMKAKADKTRGTEVPAVVKSGAADLRTSDSGAHNAQPLPSAAEREEVQSLLKEAELLASGTIISTPNNEPAKRLNGIGETESGSEARPSKPAKTKRSDEAKTLSHSKRIDKELEPWKAYKKALEQKFGDQQWNPRKRISPDAITGLRSLHASNPQTYSIPRLAEYFQISSEAVRRILKSKWQPNEKQAEDRRVRWEKRGERKWSEMVELGIRPPKKWRDMGVGRAPRGEVPRWRQAPKGGEKWIEHRPPEALFAAAALQSNQQRTGSSDLASKIF